MDSLVAGLVWAGLSERNVGKDSQLLCYVSLYIHEWVYSSEQFVCVCVCTHLGYYMKRRKWPSLCLLRIFFLSLFFRFYSTFTLFFFYPHRCKDYGLVYECSLSPRVDPSFLLRSCRAPRSAFTFFFFYTIQNAFLIGRFFFLPLDTTPCTLSAPVCVCIESEPCHQLLLFILVAPHTCIIYCLSSLPLPLPLPLLRTFSYIAFILLYSRSRPRPMI